MKTERSCKCLLMIGVVTLANFCRFVNSHACDTRTQCELELSTSIDVSVTCVILPYGPTNPPCYGHGSRVVDCNCVNPESKLSEVGATYWCNETGDWDGNLFELQCKDPCYTDAGYNVVAENPAGEQTDIIQDGEYVQYSCPESFTSIGTPSVQCFDGVWDDHEIFECKKDCSLPSGYVFNGIRPDRIIDGTFVSIRCEKGQASNKVVMVECKNGKITVESCFQDVVLGEKPSAFNRDDVNLGMTTCICLTTPVPPTLPTDIVTIASTIGITSETLSTIATHSTELTSGLTTLLKTTGTITATQEGTTDITTEATTPVVTTTDSTTAETTQTSTTVPTTTDEVTTPGRTTSVTTDQTTDVTTVVTTPVVTTTDSTTAETTQTSTTVPTTTDEVTTPGRTTSVTTDKTTVNTTPTVTYSTSETSTQHTTDVPSSTVSTLTYTTDVTTDQTTPTYYVTTYQTTHLVTPTRSTFYTVTDYTELCVCTTMPMEATVVVTPSAAELPCERPDISSDENLSITPDETSYLPGSTIAYNCQQGYQLIGNHSATCKDGCFQPPDIPNCQVQCRNPSLEDNEVELVPYKAFYNNGSSIFFSCPMDFELSGPESALCVEGHFDLPQQPTCKGLPCPRPVVTDETIEVTPNKTEYTDGDIISFNCSNENDILVGSEEAECNQGYFDVPVDPSCVSRSESEFCYPPAVGEGVIVIPDVDVYTTNATVNLTCSNTGKVLSPEDAVQVCMGENSWDPSSIVVCKNCVKTSDCKGKANRVCDKQTHLCVCPPGLALNGNECIETHDVVTKIRLDATFEVNLLHSDSEEFKKLEVEICTSFQVTLTRRNTNVKRGYVACFVFSFTNGSIVADVVTQYDTKENVTAENVNDVIVTESLNQPGGNYTLPYLSSNFTLGSTVSTNEFDVDACEDSALNICDPVYGVCLSNGDTSYTCSCNETSSYDLAEEEDIHGVSCDRSAVVEELPLGLIFGLSFGLFLVLLIFLVLLVVMYSRYWKKKNPNDTDPPGMALLPIRTIGQTKSEYDLNNTTEFGNLNGNSDPHFEEFSYTEGSIDDELKDEQMKKIERVIQNMGR